LASQIAQRRLLDSNQPPRVLQRPGHTCGRAAAGPDPPGEVGDGARRALADDALGRLEEALVVGARLSGVAPAFGQQQVEIDLGGVGGGAQRPARLAEQAEAVVVVGQGLV
jgi:hypothetical protein